MSRLGAVTVTYFPDLAILRRQISRLPVESLKIIVDNTEDSRRAKQIAQHFGTLPGILLIQSTNNVGLGAAMNHGVKLACQQGCEWVLLLDQDTEPEPGSVELLLKSWNELRESGKAVGAVGPLLRDPDSLVEHGFHVQKFGFWLRYNCSEAKEIIRVSTLNGSGTLLATADFEALGGLNEELFIDHIDTEWSFRMLDAGYALYGIPRARFAHRMGMATRKLWLFGWRAWPERTPDRHYYLFRNTIILLRKSHIPISWKIQAPIKLMATAFLLGIFDKKRAEQMESVKRGISEGIRNW